MGQVAAPRVESEGCQSVSAPAAPFIWSPRQRETSAGTHSHPRDPRQRLWRLAVSPTRQAATQSSSDVAVVQRKRDIIASHDDVIGARSCGSLSLTASPFCPLSSPPCFLPSASLLLHCSGGEFYSSDQGWGVGGGHSVDSLLD